MYSMSSLSRNYFAISQPEAIQHTEVEWKWKGKVGKVKKWRDERVQDNKRRERREDAEELNDAQEQ